MIDEDALQTLVSNAVQGDREALAQLLYVYRDRLAGLIDGQIPASLRRRLDAEDIVQEACFRAARHAASFRADDYRLFFSWLVTIAENALRDEIRRHRGPTGSGGKLIAGQQGASSMFLLSEVAADDGSSPSSHVAADQAVELIREAVEQLPEKYCEVMRLIYVQDMTAVATAQRLDLKENAVYMRVARAKEMLRERLGGSSNFFS